MNAVVSAIVASLLLTGSAETVAARSAERVDLQGSVLKVGDYRVDLGEPDDSKAPRAWQGPLRVSGPAKSSCTVDPNVAILQRPFGLSYGHLLAVSTYSGSEARVYVIDLRDCAVKAKTPASAGAATIFADEVGLPGLGRFEIAADGLLSRIGIRRR